jgi:hypothetical protein
LIEEIKDNNQLLVLILRSEFKADGIKFFTPNHFSQQLGYMNRPKGFVIQPHIHNFINRDVQLTQEVLFIKSGRVKMDIFNLEKEFIQSTVLNKGDTVLLAAGGHGFTMLEKSEIIEVKTGPHVGEKDKTRFNSNEITDTE